MTGRLTRYQLDPLVRSERRAVRLHAAERIWYGCVTAIAVCVILASAVMAGAVSPTMCAACHRAEADALHSSTHRGVACDRCHTGASVFGLVQSRLATVDMLAWQVVPGRPDVAASIDTKRCLGCHADAISRTVTVKGIKMSHAAIVTADWPCERCHPTVAHPAPSRASVGYTMDLCLQCHSTNAADIASCQTCHADRGGGSAPSKVAATPWRVIHGRNWRQTHGMGDLGTCKACHPADYCVQCHNINVPHSDGYLSMHGADVLSRSRGSSDCMVCHREGTCDNCHGIQMPHPTGFFEQHSKVVKRDGSKSCYTCHSSSSCQQCHTRHTHPGLPVQQREWLQKNPVQ